MNQSERLRFVNQDFGPRDVPAAAVLLDKDAEEADLMVFAWREHDDSETVFLQQGYDLIVLSKEAFEALAAMPA